MWTGICLDSIGRHDLARICYQNALELNDADHEAMIHLCINLHRSGPSKREIDLMGALLGKVESSPSSYVASSWKYISEETNVWNNYSVHYFTYDMMKLAMDSAKSDSLKNGLILEFGVYFGKTIRMMANNFPDDIIHGFDTFEGLPGDWFNTKQGSYSTDGTIPKAPNNVKLYKGLFSDTLPGFLDDQPPDIPVRLMNIDCDMYASTKDIFDLINDRVRPGTVIIFDEYVGNPNWKKDEFKAFQEAVDSYGWSYEYIGISMVSQQAIVRII